MRAHRLLRVWTLLVLAALAGCATAPSRISREPPNLTPHKQQLRAYVDSGQYRSDIATVAAKASAWIEERAARRAGGERLAVVFDLDETLFENWPQISANDFGWIPKEWDAWVASGRAPAIGPVRGVYSTVRRLGIDVIFLTGRHERERADTEENLRAIGCADYAALICKPDDATGTSAEFKTAARQKLVSEGRTIIANLGDQQSDLSGGFAERTFKLPNPFYLTE